MNDYARMTESELLSEMDLITSELEARMEQDRRESEETEESMKLLYRTMGWTLPEEKDPAVTELDMRMLFCIEHEVRTNDKCISTWWSPKDERKVLEVVDTKSHEEKSIFCDGLTHEEFCAELEDLLK